MYDVFFNIVLKLNCEPGHRKVNESIIMPI